MAILAGEIVSAGRLNRLQPVTYDAVCSSALTVTTTETDVDGASVTFTTAADGAVYVVEGIFDIIVDTASAGVNVLGRCAVDGVPQTASAPYEMNATDRGPANQVWRGTLGSAGSHTIKLRASKTGAGGVARVLNINSTLTVTIYEVV
jgi:hypothetical protein